MATHIIVVGSQAAHEKITAELEVQKRIFAKQLANEKECFCGLQKLTLQTLSHANKKIEGAKAEKERLMQEFEKKIKEEKRRNYDRQQKILQKWWEANNELAQIKAQQQASIVQLAAKPIKPQQAGV